MWGYSKIIMMGIVLAMFGVLMMADGTTGQLTVNLTVSPDGSVQRTLDPTGVSGDIVLDYTLNVTNRGLIPDNITVSTEGVASDLVPLINGSSSETVLLGPGESALLPMNVTASANYDADNYTFDAVARGQGNDEDRKLVNIKVIKGDLRIGDIELDDDSLTEGDNAVISVIVQNIGDAKAEDVFINVSIDGVIINSRIMDLDIDSNNTITIDWSDVKEGSQKIRVEVTALDIGIVVDKSKTVEVSEKADDGGDDEGLGFGTAEIGLLMIVAIPITLIFMRRRD